MKLLSAINLLLTYKDSDSFNDYPQIVQLLPKVASSEGLRAALFSWHSSGTEDALLWYREPGGVSQWKPFLSIGILNLAHRYSDWVGGGADECHEDNLSVLRSSRAGRWAAPGFPKSPRLKVQSSFCDSHFSAKERHLKMAGKCRDFTDILLFDRRNGREMREITAILLRVQVMFCTNCG